MGRVKFKTGQQRIWINKLIFEHNSNTNELAKICGVSSRTVRDWKREKFTISKDAFDILNKKFDLLTPPTVKYVKDYWYITKGARKGALKRLELYGPPGTKEGRIKGGKISQQKRRENPDRYRLLNCNVAKEFPVLTKSISSAELAGIILGDGGITHYQIKISLDRNVDRAYAENVKEIVKLVIGEYPAFYDNKNDNVINLCISGVNLIHKLSEWGIKEGNKIKNLIDFPKWIWESPDYQRACVRGLMDTDGCVYFHHHSMKGLKYRNLGLCFVSYSRPLLLSVSKVFDNNNIKHSTLSRGSIYIYDLEVVKKYFKIFGTSNPKHRNKFDYHLSHSTRLN